MNELKIDINGYPCLSPEQSLRLKCLENAAIINSGKIDETKLIIDATLEMANAFYDYVKGGEDQPHVQEGSTMMGGEKGHKW